MRSQIHHVMIEAKNLGKKYGKNWIFRELDIKIENGSKVAITGKNGSGKSTLLQILSGYLTPTEGKVLYEEAEIDLDQLNSVYIGPYTEIVEEFTLREFLSFHARFKNPIMSFEEMANKASLPLDRVIHEFSTGMKQRTKLITAFYFVNNYVFMDEPTSNLDEEGFIWWASETRKLNQIVLLATNQKDEQEVTDTYVNL